MAGTTQPRRIHVALLLMICVLAAGLALGQQQSAFADTFEVNTTADPASDGSCDPLPGDCTLREAIILANDGDTIVFDIAGTGPHVIAPTTALPAISESITINGACGTCDGAVLNSAAQWQGSNHNLEIIISGQLIGAVTNGLTISNGTVQIRGLVINSWTGSGIYINGGANHIISGNVIGAVRQATSAAPNNRGITLDAGTNVLIGGTSAASRNIISGNDNEGIRACAPSPDGLTIKGNFIGTRANGTAALPNGTGIRICQLDNPFIGDNAAGAGNLISGNDTHGIEVSNTVGPFIQGNRVGTTGDGSAALPNTFSGIVVSNTVGALVGGGAVSDGNLVSGNGSNGISVSNADSTNILNNITGLNLMKTAAVGNEVAGINLSTVTNTLVRDNFSSGNENGLSISSGSAYDIHENFFGYPSDAVQVGNSLAGIALFGAPTNIDIGEGPSSGNTIRGNGTHGISIAGTATNVDILENIVRDNDANGISVSAAATGIRIGSTTAGEENVLTGNGDDGIAVTHSSARVRILGNRIFTNGLGPTDLNIDIGAGGQGTNDLGDLDIGANNLQNHPEILHAYTNGALTYARVRLVSTPNSQFTIELFGADACDEGKTQALTFAGRRISAVTSPGGTWEDDITLDQPFDAGGFLTATATDQGPSVTSEFSPECVEIEFAIFIDTPGAPATFQLDDVTVDRGTAVTFVNRDVNVHNATSDLQKPQPAAGPYFDSGDIDPESVFTFTFDVSGDYTYFCDFHPGMTGIIRVVGDNPMALPVSAIPDRAFLESGPVDVVISGSGFTSLTTVELIDGVTAIGGPIEVLAWSTTEMTVRILNTHLNLPGSFDLALGNPAPLGGGGRVDFRVIRWPTDVQCDIDIDSVDVLAIMRKLAGFTDGILPEDCDIDPIFPNADVNRDGNEDIGDVLFARSRIAGLVEDIE